MKKYLEVADVSVKIGKKTIIDNFSLSVQKGEFWSILGPNGSGKTTFLKTIGGWLPYFTGEIFLDNKNISKMHRKEIARKIGMVTVEEGNNSFTVEETVFMGRFAHLGRFGSPLPDDMDKTHDAMNQIGIYDKKNRYMNELSQGERQKVWIARALAQDVELLLLDEPTSHLDVKSQSEVFLIFEKLCQEKKLAIVAILHDINLALSFSSHLFFIREGCNLACGEKNSILNAQNLTNLYGMNFDLDMDEQGDYWAKVCYRRQENEETGKF